MSPKPDTPATLDAQALKALAPSGLSTMTPLACSCSVGTCDGWESVSDDRWPAQHMSRLGTLRAPVDPDAPGHTEATFEEFHPEGTRYESANAPIAPLFYPYNRCDVFECSTCQRVLLKYTEFGGYYVDHRVRALQVHLVV
ncbi:MAG: hypothetical protein CFE38_18095 [Comamonadaceae bacterium PBBC1]|nr:MAG: hypothetical protein CFE38_18095 [Comamonadaceae bacterium PBBC1]